MKKYFFHWEKHSGFPKYHGWKNPPELGPHERIQQKSNYDIAE